jgi:hypothetical protein
MRNAPFFIIRPNPLLLLYGRTRCGIDRLPGKLFASFYSVFMALQTIFPSQIPFYPQKVAQSQRLRGPKVYDAFYVIESCKNHQHGNDCQPNPEPHFLGPIGQRFTADRLQNVEQKVATIQEWDGEQI